MQLAGALPDRRAPAERARPPGRKPACGGTVGHDLGDGPTLTRHRSVAAPARDDPIGDAGPNPEWTSSATHPWAEAAGSRIRVDRLRGPVGRSGVTLRTAVTGALGRTSE